MPHNNPTHANGVVYTLPPACPINVMNDNECRRGTLAASSEIRIASAGNVRQLDVEKYDYFPKQQSISADNGFPSDE